jgi:hypothetical protein
MDSIDFLTGLSVKEKRNFTFRCPFQHLLLDRKFFSFGTDFATAWETNLDENFGVSTMANWWKCKVVKPSMMIPFSTGEVIFAKNGNEYITLFDGRQETRVPKGALKHLQLVGRMQKPDSDQIQNNYEHKMEALAAWDHRDVTG